MLQQNRQNHSHNFSDEINFKNDFNSCVLALGLTGKPSLKEVRDGYKLLIKQWHPDRFHEKPEMEKLAVKKTQQINFAYRYLLNSFINLEEEKSSISGDSHRHKYDWQTYSEGFPDAQVSEYFLNSSHIVSAGYRKSRKILYLKFLGNEIFLYFDVPEFIFGDLLRAQSAGKYAQKFIYERFRHRKFISLIRNFKFGSK